MIKLGTPLSFERIFLASLLLLFITPILPQPLKIAAISFFGCLCIFDYVKQRSNFKWKYFLFNSSIYLIYLTSLFYSENLDYAFKKLEVGASLIIFPLFFSLISTRLIDFIMQRVTYVFIAFIATVLAMNVVLVTGFVMESNRWDLFVEYAPYVNRFSYGFKAHSLYLSMHNAVAIIMVFYLLHKRFSFTKGIILFIVGFLLGMGLILLLKKGSVLSLILVITLLSFTYKLKRIWAFYALIIFSLATVLFVFPSSISRFNQLLRLEKVEQQKSSAELQNIIYECAEQKFDDAGFFGYGIGDGKYELIDCYIGTHKDLVVSSYNSHNQYVSLILMVGFLGLALFLLMLFYNLVHSIKNGVYITVAFILFYSILMFSENLLERQDGVLYFSLLINLLFFLTSKEKLINGSSSVQNLKFDA